MNRSLKFIAYYFPQYHPIKENDEWWGEGYTDWILVKNAKPLYKGHYQPRIPLGRNYYNPTNIQTLRWQVDLAKKYGIHGFCFHHYWFDGKLLLEKPIKLFLGHKDLDLPFCLSWANESWTKRWVGKNNVMLQDQKHTPDHRIWESHFNYLLPFFKDDRYIYIDDKPVFIIYQPYLLKKPKEMFLLWEELAIKNGLHGIYKIATQHHLQIPESIYDDYHGMIKFQPREAYNSKSFTHKSIFSRFQFLRNLPPFATNILSDIKHRIYNYEMIDIDTVWDSIIKNAERNRNGPLKIFESVFIEWDNTARYGKKSKIFAGASPEKFKYWLTRLIGLIPDEDIYVFINAWNEWSESAYLEPDEKYGYKYLETVKSVLDSTYPDTD